MDGLLANFGERNDKASQVVDRVERVIQATEGFEDQRKSSRYRPIVYSNGTTTVKAGVVGYAAYHTRIEIQPPNEELLARLKRVHKALQSFESGMSLWPDK